MRSLVSFEYEFLLLHVSTTWHCLCLAELPKVTSQPKSLKKVVPGTAVPFTLQATGTEPLSYLWQWKPAEEEGGSEEWQPCPAEWSDGATLTIPSVQKSNEGRYHCIINNCGGTVISKPVQLGVGKTFHTVICNPCKKTKHTHVLLPAHTFLHVAEPPRITSHPEELKDAVPGKPVVFTAEATGTEPLGYQWEWKPAIDDEEWQLCGVKKFPGADSSTLTIPSVQKSNEGSYRCIVSNCAGSQTSNPAFITVGKCSSISPGRV